MTMNEVLHMSRMKANPRPIPVNYELIISMSEQIIEGFDDWLISFQGSPCFDLDYSLWEYPIHGCYNDYVKHGAGTRIFIPIDATVTDVLGKTYPINDIHLTFRAERLPQAFINMFGDALWTQDKPVLKAKLPQLKQELQTLREDIALFVNELSTFDFNDLDDDEMNDVRNAMEILLDLEVREKRLKDTVEVYEITRRDGGMIGIELHLHHSPHEIYDFLQDPQNRRSALHIIQTHLVHELTHLRDPQIHSRDSDYFNRPHEVRAEMHRLIFKLWRDLIYEQTVDWNTDLKPLFRTQPFDQVFGNYLENFYWDEYTPKNRAKIRSAVVQWLQENGFDLPRRHF